MTKRRQRTLKFDELYLEPVQACNLDCVVCYTAHKAKARLTMEEMLDFAIKQDAYERQFGDGLELVYFCGTGEVFVLKYFAETLRRFNAQFPDCDIQVQTNGTYVFPDLDFEVTWNLSIDGLEKEHDANRGKGTFKQTIEFLEAARDKDDDVYVRTIVGAWNQHTIKEFQAWLKSTYGLTADLIARSIKPKSPGKLWKKGYTTDDEFGVPSHDLAVDLSLKSAILLDRQRPRPGDCHQISIFPNRQVSFCCEAPVFPCNINATMEEIENHYMRLLGPCSACSLKKSCWQCIKPEFNCGMQDLMELNSCKDVIREIQTK